MHDKYDVLIIGGGPGGYVAAIRAGQLADVERLLIKLLRRADGIPPPAVQRSWFSDGLDDGLRRLAQALQRGRQVGRTL